MEEYKRRKIILPLLLGFSLIAILVLAGGLTDLRFKPGKSLNLIAWILAELAEENTSDLTEIQGLPNQSNLLPEVGDALLKSLVVFFWLMLIFSILMLIVSPKFRRELVRTFTLVAFMMIVLPQIAKNLAQKPLEGEIGIPGGYGLGDAAFPQPPAFVQNPPEWLILAVNVFFFFLIMVSVFFLWRRFRSKPDAKTVVVKEVRRALSNLESGLEFKDVVIACYAQMCQGLQASRQIQRHQAMTPREFENHLSNAGIGSIHIQQLTRLFEGVRYGAKTSDAATENEAKRCLRSILEVYGD